MDEPRPESEAEAFPDLPAPAQRRRRLSLVWLIPLVAAAIGAWMAFKAYAEKGPTITITFQNAEGLEAGQTRIRHKDVEVGKVTAVSLSPDFSQVVVTAELNKEAYGFLSENSRFWVVRARVGTNGVSALGTLFSGAYIGMDPGPRGRPQESFKGLETVPFLAPTVPGELVELRAEQLGSLNIGSPVTYRQIPVGEVAGFDLDPDGRSVLIKLVVHAPYDRLVHPDSRFWDAGGVDVSLDANGLRLHSASMVQLFLGGIAFENPQAPDPSLVVQPGQPYTLYPDHDKVYEKVYRDQQRFLLDFSESIRGLAKGAPVEFRGMRVGEVEDYSLEFQSQGGTGRIPVTITLEPGRFGLPGPRRESLEQLLARLVRQGLRAQLKTGSLLTGNLFVDMDFYPGAKPAALAREGGRWAIPTIPSTLNTLVDNLARFADRLQKLPLEQVAGEARATLPALRETLDQTRALMARLDTETAPQAAKTLAQAQATLATLERTLAADSPAQADLHQALDDFSKAARALRDLADGLERHPESLIFGKGKNP